MKKKYVLVGCEESQTVTKEFRKLGIVAYSCDILECSGNKPEWHIKGDVIQYLGKNKYNDFKGWDLAIFHPPCVYLTNAGAVHYYGKNAKNVNERIKKGMAAKNFFLTLLNAEIPRVAVENPQPLKMFKLPLHTQIIQPYEFGHPYRKKTLLWLKNLPLLKPTKIINNPQSTKVAGNWFNKGGKNRQRNRSKTFIGIAQAMAQQWGGLL